MIIINAYILIIIADLLLAGNFVFQKKYQKIAGTSVKAGLVFNGLLGVVSAVMYIVMNKFCIHITTYSLIMATLYTVFIMVYVFIGFKIMEKGNMSLYTLFLMAGGMTVPFVWGVVFWQEQISVWRVLGLVAIVGSMVISTSGINKPDKKQILLCVAVFFLNGLVSVTSKAHQISEASKYVTAEDFALIAMIAKAVICFVALAVISRKATVKERLPLKPVLWVSVMAGVIGGLASLFMLVGAVSVPATILYPLNTGGCVIFTALAGWIFCKEKITKRQWTGIAICFIGTLLFL